MPTTNNSELLYFQGVVTFDIVSDLLNKLEESVKPLGIEKLRYKRLFSTAVEILENIQMHSMKLTEGPHPSFRLSFKNNEFKIESCNIIQSSDRANLVDKIEYLNNNLPNLSEMFNMNLMNKNLSEKGGAGLGLYIIRRNSTEKISYKTEPINDNHFYFCITVIV
jgi:hypothetical protein